MFRRALGTCTAVSPRDPLSPSLSSRWHDLKVSSLFLGEPLAVDPRYSVGHTIGIMNRESYDQLPVVSETGAIVGVVTLGSLRSKLLHGRILSTDSVEKAAYTTFERVSGATSLRELDRVLHREHFALVVDEACPSWCKRDFFCCC